MNGLNGFDDNIPVDYGDNETLIGLLKPETQASLRGLSEGPFVRRLIELLVSKEQQETRDIEKIRAQRLKNKKLRTDVKYGEHYSKWQDKLIKHQNDILIGKQARIVQCNKQIEEQNRSIEDQNRSNAAQAIKIKSQQQSIRIRNNKIRREKNSNDDKDRLIERLFMEKFRVEDDIELLYQYWLQVSNIIDKREKKSKAKILKLETLTKFLVKPRRSPRLTHKK